MNSGQRSSKLPQAPHQLVDKYPQCHSYVTITDHSTNLNL